MRSYFARSFAYVSSIFQEGCERPTENSGYQGLASTMLDRLPLALVELCMARLEVHIMLRCARVCRLTKQALSGN